MQAAEALAIIRGFASVYRIRYLPHARRRMRERGVGEEDVQNALANATGCKEAEIAPRWVVEGPDRDGDLLDVVVEIDGEDIVITIY